MYFYETTALAPWLYKERKLSKPDLEQNRQPQSLMGDLQAVQIRIRAREVPPSLHNTVRFETPYYFICLRKIHFCVRLY